MRCERFTHVAPDGSEVRGYVCTSGRRSRPKPCVGCGRASTLLCDGAPPKGSRRKTCDAAICTACAEHVGPEIDHCPTHRTTTATANSLRVHTARISYAGADRFDITRKSGVEGLVFAPSWDLLRPYLDRRRLDPADNIAEWGSYSANYRLEMLRSYTAHRAAWEALLARSEVTLVCYCTRADRCHRRLLAGYLAKLGAIDAGERTP